jgi:hypothetical protein
MSDMLHDPHPVLIVCPPALAMTIHATGPSAEAEVRQLCSGHLPQVDERYVWVCTAVHTAGEAISVHFQLTPMEEQ